MKASKMPIHRTGSSLLPLSVYAVVFVDFWPDVTDKGQKVIQDLIPVLPEVGLEDGHLLLGVLLHFSAAAAVGSQSRSLLGLELLSFKLKFHPGEMIDWGPKPKGKLSTIAADTEEERQGGCGVRPPPAEPGPLAEPALESHTSPAPLAGDGRHQER